jgi:hypothetical protein
MVIAPASGESRCRDAKLENLAATKSTVEKSVWGCQRSRTLEGAVLYSAWPSAHRRGFRFRPQSGAFQLFIAWNVKIAFGVDVIRSPFVGRVAAI